MLPKGEAANVHEFLFQGVKMACHSAISVELVTLEGEASSDAIAQRVQDFFKFRNFYNQMDFSNK